MQLCEQNYPWSTNKNRLRKSNLNAVTAVACLFFFLDLRWMFVIRMMWETVVLYIVALIKLRQWNVLLVLTCINLTIALNERHVYSTRNENGHMKRNQFTNFRINSLLTQMWTMLSVYVILLALLSTSSPLTHNRLQTISNDNFIWYGIYLAAKDNNIRNCKYFTHNLHEPFIPHVKFISMQQHWTIEN